MKALYLRIVRQMINDKRSLALMLIAPLLILSLLYLLLGDSAYRPVVGVTDGLSDKFLAGLEKQDVSVREIGSADESGLLCSGDVDAVVSMNANGIYIRLLESSGGKEGKVVGAVKSALTLLNPSMKIEVSYLYGNAGESTFNSLGFVLLGILSFFFVFIISGISFVRERTTGTLERLMITPIRRSSVAGGYTVGFGFFAALQSMLIVLFTRYVLRMEFVGSVLLAMTIMILLAFTAVSAGCFVSIFSNSEFQVMQFIPVVIIPQIFFSGLIPVDMFPYRLGALAYLMPVYYGCSGLRGVLVRGVGIEQIWPDLVVLAAFNAFFFLLNVFALKKYRKI